MKKKFVSILLMLVVIVGSASAAGSVRASKYLSGYGVSLSAAGGGQMKVGYDVDEMGLMTKIGVQTIYIEKKIDGVWKNDGYMFASEFPSFYAYDAYGHSGYVYFTGTPGVDYRVTITALAMNASGSDTGDGTSITVTCK